MCNNWKKMRIVFVTPSMSVGGSSSVIFDLLSNWPNKKDELYLISFYNSFSARFNDLKINNQIKIIFLNKRNKFDLKFLSCLKNTIIKIRPDCISSHLSATFYLWICRIHKKFKIFHTIHAEPQFDLPHLYRVLLNQSIRKKQIKLIGCCDYISRKAKELYNVNCFSIRNGISGIQEKNIKSTEKIIKFVFVGRFDKVKNIPLIINSFFECRSSNWSLTLIGDGALYNEANNIVSASPKSTKVNFLGYQINIDKLLNNYDVICLLSEREGMPIVLLEGLKNGKAFLASNRGGISEVVEDHENGILINNLTVSTISENIDYICSNQKLIDSFKRNSLNKFKNFAADKMCIKYREVFQNE